MVDELCIQMQGDLPALLLKEDAGPNTFILRGEHMDSLATCLGQELIRFNKLLRRMDDTLDGLRKAIRGEVLLSADLDLMYSALLNNTVPPIWAAVAYPSLKPLASWIIDLVARVKFLRGWLTGGQPDVFWLSGFYFPQGFMTGTLQNHARKYKLPIDTLSFKFKVYPMYNADEVTEVRFLFASGVLFAIPLSPFNLCSLLS